MAALSSSDKEKRRAIRDARAMIQQAEKSDGNESETRRRIERMFENIMGYDPFKHLSRERAVRGAGETEHVDFAIQLDAGEDVRPLIMVEIKRVAIDLAIKHLKQVTSYAIDAGCEWALLTNGREWRLYHVAFGQPPETREVRKWNILTDEIPALVEQFDLLSLRSLKRGVLDDLWKRESVLLPKNLLEAIVSQDGIQSIRKQLRKKSSVNVPPEEIVSGIRRLLNESSLAELDDINITLPKKVTRKRRSKKEMEAARAESTALPPPPSTRGAALQDDEQGAL